MTHGWARRWRVAVAATVGAAMLTVGLVAFVAPKGGAVGQDRQDWTTTTGPQSSVGISTNTTTYVELVAPGASSRVLHLHGFFAATGTSGAWLNVRLATTSAGNTVIGVFAGSQVAVDFHGLPVASGDGVYVRVLKTTGAAGPGTVTLLYSSTG